MVSLQIDSLTFEGDELDQLQIGGSNLIEGDVVVIEDEEGVICETPVDQQKIASCTITNRFIKNSVVAQVNGVSVPILC